MNASENYSIHEIVESGHEAIKYLAGNHNPVENAYFTAVFENAIAHLEYIERLDWPGPDGLGSILTVILQLCDDEELAYPFSQIMQIRNLNASVENPLTQSQLNTVGQLPWYRMILDFGCATAKTEGSWKTYEIFSKAVTGLELLMAHEIPSPSILGATIWCTLTTEETVAKLCLTYWQLLMNINNCTNQKC